MREKKAVLFSVKVKKTSMFINGQTNKQTNEKPNQNTSPNLHSPQETKNFLYNKELSEVTSGENLCPAVHLTEDKHLEYTQN